MTPSKMLELTTDNVADYLDARGVLRSGEVRTTSEFGGGVSSVVIRVRTADLDLVVKQPLERLRTAIEWHYDRGRMIIERNALVVLSKILPPGATPRLVDSDEDNYIIVMTCAPDGGEVWKTRLMRGEADTATAGRAGVLLATLHRTSAREPALRTLFPSNSNFIEGRIKPYFETAAIANPDSARDIQREVERLLSQPKTLVHGDFSPKNIIAYHDHILLLDHEVAHFGDPSFDVGFCLTHLCLKALHFAPRYDGYLQCARSFWDEYSSTMDATLLCEGDCVRQLGAIMLARVDGKSRLEYLQNEVHNTVRQLAKELLRLSKGSIPDAIEQVRAACDSRHELEGTQ